MRSRDVGPVVGHGWEAVAGEHGGLPLSRTLPEDVPGRCRTRLSPPCAHSAPARDGWGKTNGKTNPGDGWAAGQRRPRHRHVPAGPGGQPVGHRSNGTAFPEMFEEHGLWQAAGVRTGAVPSTPQPACGRPRSHQALVPIPRRSCWQPLSRCREPQTLTPLRALQCRGTMGSGAPVLPPPVVKRRIHGSSAVIARHKSTSYVKKKKKSKNNTKKKKIAHSCWVLRLGCVFLPSTPTPE